MRTLIVDEDVIARKILIDELDLLKEVEIVGQLPNSAASASSIAEAMPDLVFIGLRTPADDSFSLLRGLTGASPPYFVIVAPFDDQAAAAFELGAIDYLLKPVKEARLRQAVVRALMLINKRCGGIDQRGVGDLFQLPGTPQPMQRIVGRFGDQYILLHPSEILAFQAERDCVWIFTKKDRYLATQTLRGIEARVKHLPFQRIHRNALVNLSHVRKMTALSSKRWQMTLSNSLELTVSKRQAQNAGRILHL